MSAIRSVVLGAVLMASMGAAPAVAQGAKFSLGGGLTLPFGDLRRRCQHRIPRPRGRRLPAGRLPRRHPDRRHVSTASGSTMRPMTSTAASRSSRARRTPSTGSRRPEEHQDPSRTSSAASACTTARLTGDDIPDDSESETDFGINGGAGFDFDAGSVGLFVEGRFHNVFTEGDSTNFIPITVGIRFGGS